MDGQPEEGPEILENAYYHYDQVIESQRLGRLGTMRLVLPSRGVRLLNRSCSLLESNLAHVRPPKPRLIAQIRMALQNVELGSRFYLFGLFTIALRHILSTALA